jgi:hypothetical protein
MLPAFLNAGLHIKFLALGINGLLGFQQCRGDGFQGGQSRECSFQLRGSRSAVLDSRF